MSSSSTSNQLDDSAVVELTGKIMVVAVIVLFVVVVFFFFLHLYAKWFWYRLDHNGVTTRRRRSDFGAGHQELRPVTVFHHGLDPSVLKSIPTLKFTSQDFKDGLECAVCLSQVSDGEKARLLPKCNHGFHVECIDMWFQSHSTCPICRNPVSNQPASHHNSVTADSDSSSSSVDARIEIPAPEEVPLSTGIPTNVLFWGDETQVSAMGENQIQTPPTCNPSGSPSSSSTSSTNRREGGEMVIEIPKQMNEEEEEDSKSTMMPKRMRSFKRLLIRDRRVNPSSPRNVDVEQVG